MDAFLGYCRVWCKLVTTHAEEEERHYFPEAEMLLGERVFEQTHEEHGECFRMLTSLLSC
jgi:hemerythrin superfamily protein